MAWRVSLHRLGSSSSRPKLVVCAETTLARLPQMKAERIVIGGSLDDLRLSALRRPAARKSWRWPRAIRSFNGVARYFCDKLGKDRFDVVPHVSSMQLAFARVKKAGRKRFSQTWPIDRWIRP